MRKKFAGMIGIVLALVLVFSLGACNAKKEKTIDKGEAVGKAITALLQADGFTVNVEANAYNPATDKQEDSKELLSVKKTTNGYDYRLDTVGADGTRTAEMAKIGNIAYMLTESETTVYETYFAKDALPQGISVADLGTEITAMLSGVAGTVTSKDKTYTIEVEENYKSDVQKLIDFIVGGKDRQVGEYLAETLHPSYTRTALVNDINAIFANNITLGAMVQAIDAFFTHIHSDMTVKSIMDELFAAAEMTATDIYTLIGNASLPKPKATDTAYDYLISIGALMPVDMLLQSATDGKASLADIRGMILLMLDDDDCMFDDLYDTMVAPKLSLLVAESVLSHSKDAEFFAEIIFGDTPLLVTENLEKITVGDMQIHITAVLDSNDCRFKTISVAAKNELGYRDTDTSEKQLLKIDTTAELTFDYAAVANIAQPETGAIAPCFLVDLDTVTDMLPMTGGTQIAVFEGRGYTFTEVTLRGSDGEAIDVSYAAGKVTLSAEAVAAIWEQINQGNVAYLNILFTDADEGDYGLGCSFGYEYSYNFGFDENEYGSVGFDFAA